MINITDLVIKETELFAEWAASRPNFSPDGLINPNQYLQSKPRILFVLKEPNTKNREAIDLKNFIKNGSYGRRSTWDNITRWIHGIRNLEKEFSWKELNKKFLTVEKKMEILQTACYMNLKKSPGGYTSNEENLWTIAENDKRYLNRQLNLYEPELVISCGQVVTEILIEIIDDLKEKKWFITSRGIRYFKFGENRIFIAFAHPEARIGDHILYYSLIDAVREIYMHEKDL